jgi:phenylacetate-CoA ligase
MHAATLDARETRDPAEREASLLQALPDFVAHAKAHSVAQAARLAAFDAAAIDSRAALARVPVLRKHDLLVQQQAARASGGNPFAGHAVAGWTGLAHARPAKRVFQSPGPLYEPEGVVADSWRMSRALHAAGFRRGDLVHNSFSYHLTPAGAMMEEGALALGCTVFPGGVGNTDMQLQAMVDLRPQGYCGTPSFLKIALEKAAETGIALPSLTTALVSGEACPPSLRDWFGARGVAAYQCYATADVGLIAYETEAREGLVLDEQVIVEIVGPDGMPVPDGEVGEVVVTSFNPDYPLLRFGTGDLSAVLPGQCPSGRTNGRIRGWLGRADQTTKVRGMFVHPSQVQELQRRFPQLGRVRLVVQGEVGSDRMLLQAECAQPQDALATAVGDAIRQITKLRGELQWCAPGTLPDDGKLIEDQRSYR